MQEHRKHRFAGSTLTLLGVITGTGAVAVALGLIPVDRVLHPVSESYYRISLPPEASRILQSLRRLTDEGSKYTSGQFASVLGSTLSVVADDAYPQELCKGQSGFAVNTVVYQNRIGNLQPEATVEPEADITLEQVAKTDCSTGVSLMPVSRRLSVLRLDKRYCIPVGAFRPTFSK